MVCVGERIQTIIIIKLHNITIINLSMYQVNANVIILNYKNGIS